MAVQSNSSWTMPDDDKKISLQRSCVLYLVVIDRVNMRTLVVGGLTHNSLAFIVFWKDNLKTSASFLFLCLALVDSVMLLLVTPLFLVQSFLTYIKWLKGYTDSIPYVSVYMYHLVLIAKTSSIWVIVLFAVTRYIAVCLPFKSLRWCTISKVKKQLAFVLLSAVLYNIPRFAEKSNEYVTYDT